jgi:NAD(P)-dependent dehydrogenase (short-subunit alcohol dehydrogenase family)
MKAGGNEGQVALIVGGGPGVSSSCAKHFSREGMRVAVAARKPDKPVLVELEKEHGIVRLPCDAADATSVAALFDSVAGQLGAPNLVVHNIDGRFAEIFRKDITEADPANVARTAGGGIIIGFTTLASENALDRLRREWDAFERSLVFWKKAS